MIHWSAPGGGEAVFEVERGGKLEQVAVGPQGEGWAGGEHGFYDGFALDGGGEGVELGEGTEDEGVALFIVFAEAIEGFTEPGSGAGRDRG